MRQRTAPAKRGRFFRFRFFGEIIGELRKVVWLSRREIIYLSTLVLVVSVAAGLILGAVDYGFSALIEGIFLGS